jgi:nickel-type superoxide dismutase maturation protease
MSLNSAAILRLAALLAILLAGIHASTTFLAMPWIVSGSSMEPTLAPGELVMVDLWSYRQRLPRPGEIVLVSDRSPGGGHLVKRVASTGEEGLWLLGDNAARSVDSREFGAVPFDRVRGRIVWRYWPPERFGRVR